MFEREACRFWGWGGLGLASSGTPFPTMGLIQSFENFVTFQNEYKPHEMC